MKYYFLYPSTDLEEVGTSPQSKEFPRMGRVSDHILDGTRINKEDLPVTILDDAATSTTYLNIIRIPFNYFLTIQNELLELLMAFNLPKYNYWKIDVFHQGKLLDVYMFYLTISEEAHLVDFARSTFEIGRLGDWRDPSIRTPVHIANYNAFLNMKKLLSEQNDNSQLRGKELILNLANIDLDLFRLLNLPSLSNGYYISERLKKAIEKEGFTGMDFKEIEEHNKKIKVIY